ncbi:MAG: T9SS type A sorting domain-containing protein [Bacteroidales bacterium]|nr:T9SS type A sorting domain-containing protein [Bacteroidales bacterium]
MKKFVLLIAVSIVSTMLAYAQNDIVLYIVDRPDWQYLCIDNQQRVLIYAQDGCEEFHWTVQGQEIWNESPLIINPQQGTKQIYYDGCNFHHGFGVKYLGSNVPSEFTRTQWKRQMQTDSLVAVGHDSIEYPFNYEFHWSTGETTRTIEVTEPGTYTVEISEICGTATRTFIVRDNVEVELATCDLETNLNMVTWQTTEAQAEYVSQVEVKRDGLTVGTAPYTDGQFIDDIGSDAASRTYTVTALATDGTPCPIASYPKETIHMAYLTGINNTIEVNWNVPAGYDLLGYNICEWHEEDGSLTVIDYVGASVTSYTCSQSQFDEGYIVIQGVEASKDGETRLLSNRSSETVGIGENESLAFKVYPNPAQGTFTVEGTGRMTITNVLGQTVLAREIDGMESIGLPRGLYFVKMNGATRKVVVE